MHSTERNILLIVLFVVVFALVFAFEALHATGDSVKAHPVATATANAGGLCDTLRLAPRIPHAYTVANLTGSMRQL